MNGTAVRAHVVGDGYDGAVSPKHDANISV